MYSIEIILTPGNLTGSLLPWKRSTLVRTRAMHVDLVPILGPSFSIKLGKQGTGSYQLWLETGAPRGAFTTHQHRAQSGPIKGGPGCQVF